MLSGYSMTATQYWRKKPDEPADDARRAARSSGTGDLWCPIASHTSSMGNGVYASSLV